MIDEGVIKFRCHWRQTPAVAPERVAALNAWRRRLHALGQIGYDEQHQVGYGNLSQRDPLTGEVLITATQTGHLPQLSAQHYVRISAYDLDTNEVHCDGPLQPSAEAMTHMAIYDAVASAQAVFHVHDAKRWKALRGRIATTGAHVPYGTPAMAYELKRLCAQADFVQHRLAVMAGHDDGLIAFGNSLEEAGSAVLQHIDS